MRGELEILERFRKLKTTKRLFDIVFSSVGLLCLLPLLVGIALFLKMTEPGPVFFVQERVGFGGVLFRMYKFRTMKWRPVHEGPMITVEGDLRITRVGRWLRKYKMDELPQLYNVLRGEMSLVGPRPEVQKYVDCYTPDQRDALSLVPGITDPASVKYRDESLLLSQSPDPESLYLNEILPDKIRINLDYAAKANLLTDLTVIGRTLLKLF